MSVGAACDGVVNVNGVGATAGGVGTACVKGLDHISAHPRHAAEAGWREHRRGASVTIFAPCPAPASPPRGVTGLASGVA